MSDASRRMRNPERLAAALHVATIVTWVAAIGVVVASWLSSSSPSPAIWAAEFTIGVLVGVWLSIRHLIAVYRRGDVVASMLVSSGPLLLIIAVYIGICIFRDVGVPYAASRIAGILSPLVVGELTALVMRRFKKPSSAAGYPTGEQD